MKKLMIGVGIVVALAFAPQPTTKANAPISDFRVVIALSSDGAQLECERGCAWKTLSFDCKGKQPCKAQIDQNGVRGVGK